MKKGRVLIGPNRYRVMDVPDDYVEPAMPEKVKPAPIKVELPVNFDCPYRGNKLETCHTCKSGRKDVYECDVWSKCTLIPVSTKVKDCQSCFVPSLCMESLSKNTVSPKDSKGL